MALASSPTATILLSLIEIATIEDTVFIEAEQLQQVEKCIRFYYDLDIEMMKNKQYICYDFKNIVKSYPSLPAILNKFQDYAFAFYGLKFIDIDYC